mmetsp:Transcript_9219/g.15804  ORF Transcript_9219/g.15804 Transcript_9219/m.15804 type:complete len:334 (+) Transcript_9219:159-1160(+)
MKQDNAAADPRKLTALQHLFCGGLAGTVARTITSPLDVVKILFQTQFDPIKSGTTGRFSGFFGAFNVIYREEGVRAFWKGNGAAVVRLFPYSAIKFAFYERIRQWAKHHDGSNMAHVVHLVGGGLSAVTASLIVYPLDVVKTRLTIQHMMAGSPHAPVAEKAYKGILDCLMKVGREEGLRALYRGVVPSTIGFFIYEGGTFFWYEAFKIYLPRLYEHERQSTAVHFVSGSLAGCFAQTFSYPLDVVRKRLHAQSNHAGMLGASRYKGSMDCLMQIVRREGWLGLYKGTTANIAKVMPFAALQFVAYEQCKRLCATYNEEAALARTLSQPQPAP